MYKKMHIDLPQVDPDFMFLNLTVKGPFILLFLFSGSRNDSMIEFVMGKLFYFCQLSFNKVIPGKPGSWSFQICNLYKM